MNRLLSIYEELRDTQAELHHLEDVIAKNPNFESLAIDLMSIQKRQRVLEEEFKYLTDQKHTDIVSYRLIPSSEASRIPLKLLTSTLDRFQSAVSTIYDAIKSGTPKKRAKLSPEMVEQSGFDFAYTFTGSLGVMLTVPNQRLLVGESELDKSVKLFFEAAQATNRQQIVDFAKTAGISSVRRLYEWSSAHSQFDVSADIQWRRNKETRDRLVIQQPGLIKLQEIIEESSEVSEETVDVTGFLVGLDTSYQTFHFTFTDADDIKGAWDKTFAYNPDFTLKDRYKAKLLKRSIVHYALDKEDISWTLKSLSKLSS